MKTKAERKHQTKWGNIKIRTEKGIINFELDENGKLKDKMARQTARDLTVEMKKLSCLPDLSQSPLGQNQNMALLIQPPPFYSQNLTPSTLNANYEASLNALSSTNQVSTNSVLPDEEQEISQIDESQFFSDDYLAIEDISDDFNILPTSDDFLDDNTIFGFDDQNLFFSQ